MCKKHACHALQDLSVAAAFASYARQVVGHQAKRPCAHFVAQVFSQMLLAVRRVRFVQLGVRRVQCATNVEIVLQANLHPPKESIHASLAV